MNIIDSFLKPSLRGYLSSTLNYYENSYINTKLFDAQKKYINRRKNADFVFDNILKDYRFIRRKGYDKFESAYNNFNFEVSYLVTKNEPNQSTFLSYNLIIQYVFVEHNLASDGFLVFVVDGELTQINED
ncbi:MAG: hypothetical protein AB8G86_00120 [Saprospiraceae bacterium]